MLLPQHFPAQYRPMVWSSYLNLVVSFFNAWLAFNSYYESSLNLMNVLGATISLTVGVAVLLRARAMTRELIWQKLKGNNNATR